MNTTEKQGAAVGAGLLCYVLWGLLPLYFHALSVLGVGDFEIVANRTLWSVVWAGLLVLLARQAGQVGRVVRTPRLMGWLALSTAAIFCNWTIYVVAVNAGHIMEASLGYYINPLMNMAAGAFFFKERLNGAGKAAIALAAVGVVIQTLALGHVPLISLAVATTFCGYAVIRKKIAVDAQTGLFIECAYLSLPGLLYVLWLQSKGAGHLGGGDWRTTALLLAAGPATVAPLALFSWAARRIPLSAMGFLQFLAPTIQFAIGVALGEPLTPLRVVSFGFIWAGAAVFIAGAVIGSRRSAAALRTA
jgi:chloramphenicol-sensitive protein RarD